ncbi:metal-dependent hydrolase [Spongiimicrobium salis]|uniref:metal-dependent hydrolase n=1 Tax=Spongiimicrobium salis TaxID=1667022 RepID=UPI00374DB87D
MDSLTQIVLGAAVGEAVLGKKVGNKAMMYGAIAGTIPDLDVLARYFTDALTTIEVHRGFSHSLVFSVLFAPVFGWLISKVERKQHLGWKPWSWLMFWGLVTHPLLDAHTTWGTQFFWPLDLRLAYKNIFVIDPLYTLPFLVFLLLAMRQKKTSPLRSWYNSMGLIVSSTYLGVTLMLKGLSYTKFTDALEKQGVAYTAISTRTTPFNAILWTANVDAGDHYLIGNYSFFDSKPIQFRSYPKNHAKLGALQEHPKLKRLMKIAEYWFTISEKEGNLYFNDLRFGLVSLDPKETQFAFSYKLTKEEEVLTIEESPRFGRADARKLFLVLWDRIWGN